MKKHELALLFTRDT